MSVYQIGILGRPTTADVRTLEGTLAEMIAPFGIKIPDHLNVLDADACIHRDPKQAFAAVYFGSNTADQPSIDVARSILESSQPLLPFVDDLRDFSAQIPATLRFANGMDRMSAGSNFQALAAALLECIGLLRQQRRVFISYKRSEASAAALQVHDALSSAGFDTFLDTHDVRPAEDFQAMLWHRLCDSDALIMLDTPGYFSSRWTPLELGRALAKKIAVFAMVWPGHTPERTSQLRESMLLDASDLLPSGMLQQSAVDKIKFEIERIRSKSLALRHTYIAGAIRSALADIGGSVHTVTTHRLITASLPNSRRVHFFPAVGIPTAETYYEMAVRNARLSPLTDALPVLVYDHIGLHPKWMDHLAWLGSRLTDMRTIKISQAGWDIAELEG